MASASLTPNAFHRLRHWFIVLSSNVQILGGGGNKHFVAPLEDVDMRLSN